jgi:hypothetical protein
MPKPGLFSKDFQRTTASGGAPHARQTTRLGEIIRLIGYIAGGLPGSRILQRLAIPISNDTVIRAIKRSENTLADDPVRCRRRSYALCRDRDVLPHVGQCRQEWTWAYHRKRSSTRSILSRIRFWLGRAVCGWRGGVAIGKVSLKQYITKLSWPWKLAATAPKVRKIPSLLCFDKGNR